MKKIVNSILTAVALLTVACHKDSALTMLQPVAFTGQLTESTKTVTLTATTDTLSEVTFKWPAIVYPYKAPVTYVIQADVPADTVGATPWGGAASVAVGKDILTKTLKGVDLNTLAFNLGIAANANGTLVFRVQAYEDRFAYTNSVSMAITTYKAPVAYSAGYPVLWVPGDYQGWSPSTAPTVAAEKPNIYEGYIYEIAGGTYQFKFTTAQDWNHINYGDNGNGTLTTNGNAAGMTLPGAGYYELVCNPVALTWNYTKVTWGIIGDATPGGWNADTQMAFDPVKQVWTVTCAMVSTGSFKFRANSAWNIDFGIDANNRLQYADNPAYPYNGSLNNLTVAVSGNYTITLDLHDPNNYNYTLKKN